MYLFPHSHAQNRLHEDMCVQSCQIQKGIQYLTTSSSRFLTSADDSHPAVIDELVPRLIHCCYADKWPQRIGGVAAVSMVMQKLPITWLQSHVPDIIKAALAVLKHLPSHASLEQAQLLKALTTVMHLVVPKVQTWWTTLPTLYLLGAVRQ